MRKSPTPAPDPHTKASPPPEVEALPENFIPSQEQIEMLARRMIPEIKRFFADEEVQHEFSRWLKQHRQIAA